MKKTIVSLLCILCFIVACDESNADSQSALAEEIFKNANEVVLIVSGDDTEWMRVALKCHGREEQCADEYVARTPDYMRATSENRDQYLARIKKDYNDYPSPLRKETLRLSLADVIKAEITPELEPIIINSGQDIKKYLNKKDTLIIFARLHVHKDVIPHIASLNLSFYRPGASPLASYESLSYARTAIIPLNLPEDQIAERIARSCEGLKLNLVKKTF